MFKKTFSRSHLGEISEVGRLTEVQLLALVVGEDPWEHWVLVQVVVRTSCGQYTFYIIEENKLRMCMVSVRTSYTPNGI